MLGDKLTSWGLYFVPLFTGGFIDPNGGWPWDFSDINSISRKHGRNPWIFWFQTLWMLTKSRWRCDDSFHHLVHGRHLSHGIYMPHTPPGHRNIWGIRIRRVFFGTWNSKANHWLSIWWIKSWHRKCLEITKHPSIHSKRMVVWGSRWVSLKTHPHLQRRHRWDFAWQKRSFSSNPVGFLGEATFFLT